MPAYDFYCDACGTTFEKNLHFGERTSDLVCPRGHTQVRRLFSAPAIHFKGSGWYSTDHRANSKETSSDS